MILSGRAFIDPTEPLPLAGYAGRDAPVAPSWEALEANWIGWRDGQGELSLVLTLDALFSSVALENALRDELTHAGVTLDELMVIASHTHFAPSLCPEKPRLGKCDPGYIGRVARQVAVSVYRSISQPQIVARVRAHGAAAPGSVHRRRRGLRIRKRWPLFSWGIQMLPNPDKAIPRTLRIWQFDDATGKAVFALVSWPCHSVSRADRQVMSADYVGPLRTVLRERLGECCPVLFLPGPSGDIRPDFRVFGGGMRGLYPYLWQTRFTAATLAQENAFDAGLCTAAKAAMEAPEMANWDVAEGGCAITSAPVALDVVLDAPQPAPMPVMALSLFGLRVLSAGAELSSTWLTELAWSGTETDRVLTGYTGPCFGYLPTDDQIAEGGYEVSGFVGAFGLKGGFDPARQVGPLVLGAFRHVLGEPEPALQPDN